MLSHCSSRDKKKVLTLGLLVEIPEVLPLLLVDDGQNSSDGLSDTVAVLSALTRRLDDDTSSGVGVVVGSCGLVFLPFLLLQRRYLPS